MSTLLHNTPANGTPPPAAAPESFVSKPVVAERLGKSVRTIDNWMQWGILPFYKIGRSVVFKWSEVEHALAQTCRSSGCR